MKREEKRESVCVCMQTSTLEGKKRNEKYIKRQGTFLNSNSKEAKELILDDSEVEYDEYVCDNEKLDYVYCYVRASTSTALEEAVASLSERKK